jgi:hypothetical protein
MQKQLCCPLVPLSALRRLTMTDTLRMMPMSKTAHDGHRGHRLLLLGRPIRWTWHRLGRSDRLHVIAGRPETSPQTLRIAAAFNVKILLEIQ